jgi:hypothetical protein
MLGPFYWAAARWSNICNRPPNGYTTIFAFFVCLAIFVYLLIGLLYLHKILSHFFDDRTVGITLLAIGLGTNLFYYSTDSFNVPHIFCFCLYNLFIWKSIQWHQKPSKKNSIIIGLLLGLMTLVRPNDIIVFIFPLLYGIYNKKTLLEKIKLLKNNWINILLAILFFIVGIMPQLIIWKYQTGSLFCYSYGDEHFYFSHPHLLKGLFGFRKGLFIYTPVLLLIIPGFIYAWKKYQNFALASVAFFLINIFIIFSWWSWWYGGSFGLRAMIGCYPLLALPLGCCVQELMRKNWFKKSIIIIFISLCIVLNQFQTLQADSNLLHYSKMTFQSYKLIFGRLTYPEGWEDSLEPNDNNMAQLGLPERDFYKTFYFLKHKRENLVALKASNGMFVSVDSIKKGKLFAESSQVGPMETFKMRIEEFDNCKIQSSNNKYVSFENLESGRLIADRDKAGDWENFVVVNMPNNKFAIRNRKYIKSNPKNDNVLEATSDTITDKELFEIIPR